MPGGATLAEVNDETPPIRDAGRTITRLPDDTQGKENQAMTLWTRSTLCFFVSRTAPVAAAALALLVPAATLSAAQVTPPAMVAKVDGPEIHIQNFGFNPPTLTVPVGTTVTWTNTDGTIHTVTSATKVFTSDGLDQGGAFSYTFKTPGSYTYFCKLHPQMTGTIVVK